MGSGFIVQSLRPMPLGSGLGDWGLGFRAQGLG